MLQKKNYKHKILQLISEYNKNAKDLDFLVLDVDNVIKFV